MGGSGTLSNKERCEPLLSISAVIGVFLLLFVLPQCSDHFSTNTYHFATVAFLQHCVEFLAITIASQRPFYENSVAFVQERHLRLI